MKSVPEGDADAGDGDGDEAAVLTGSLNGHLPEVAPLSSPVCRRSTSSAPSTVVVERGQVWMTNSRIPPARFTVILPPVARCLSDAVIIVIVDVQFAK